MPNTNYQVLKDIEKHIRFGEYDVAYKICKGTVDNLEHIKIEDLGNPTTIKFPWLIKAIGGLEDITTPNHIRNDQLISLRIKARIMTSLVLFYQNKTELGIKKIDDSVREINIYRNKLHFNYLEELNQFVDRINREIQEIHLLSSYQDKGKAEQHKEEFELEKYLSMSEEDLYLMIGQQVALDSKIESKVLNSKLLILASNNKILIPPNLTNTNDDIENIAFGKKLSSALKKSLYNILCDSKNRVGKKYVTTDSLKKLVSASIISIGITSYPLIAPFAALVIMFGIETYCEMSKPKKINDT